MAKKLNLHEKKILTLAEFANDHEGWPTLPTLRNHVTGWKNDLQGYEGDHFIKLGGQILVDRNKYFEWVGKSQLLRPPTREQ